MQKGISLVQLASQIEANKALKADYIAPTCGIAMDIDSEGVPSLDIEGAGRFPVLRTAHDQIAAHANIPVKYYNRMLADAPDLLAQNVNRWFVSDNSGRMIRTLGGDARALLSDRYQRIENEEIAEVVLPILLNEPDLQIVSCQITDRRLYIQATTPRIKGEVKVGDAVQTGIAISNSEVGQGAVKVSPLVFRLRCLNGMVLPDSAFRARHLGRQIDRAEDLNAIFSDETKRADDRALLLKVRDVVANAMSEVHFTKALRNMQELTEPRIETSPEAAVRVLGRKIGITEGEQPSILQALMRDGDLSAWGIVNAVTAQAHTAPDYDRAVEFETMGGALLDLPRREWKEILEAA